jgi:hypothetical protein
VPQDGGAAQEGDDAVKAYAAALRPVHAAEGYPGDGPHRRREADGRADGGRDGHVPPGRLGAVRDHVGGHPGVTDGDQREGEQQAVPEPAGDLVEGDDLQQPVHREGRDGGAQGQDGVGERARAGADGHVRHIPSGAEYREASGDPDVEQRGTGADDRARGIGGRRRR